MKDDKIRVVSAFPGTGKTYFANNVKDIKSIDLDSSSFSWNIKQDGTKYRKQNWTDDYMQKVKELLQDETIELIFVSSHAEVRRALLDHEINHFLVYPDESLKEAYIERYRKRGNEQDFIELLQKNWYDWIQQIDLEFFLHVAVKIKLPRDIYLSEVFKKRG